MTLRNKHTARSQAEAHRALVLGTCVFGGSVEPMRAWEAKYVIPSQTQALDSNPTEAPA